MHKSSANTITGWLKNCLLASLAIYCVACSSSALPKTQPQLPSALRLPGQEIWKDGVSSFLFGTNDTTEWSPQNIETLPAIQESLRNAGFTLIRSFFYDSLNDADIEKRIQTIENSGAYCLGVITSITNVTFDEHLVQTLGNRCLMYEFGNEPDYNGFSVNTYLQQWNTVIPLLRHINPQAKFIGPVDGPATSSFLNGFLHGVKNSGILPDAVSFHWYPCHQDAEATCLSKASAVGQEAEEVRALVQNVLGKDLPVGITEWNFDGGNPPSSYGDNPDFITKFTNAALQSMIQAGVAFACQFDAASYAGYGHTDMFDVNTDQPKPQYYAIAAVIAKYRLTPSTQVNPSSSATVGPLISRGKPTYCASNNTGPGGPGAIVNGHYLAYSFWNILESKLPSWCAIHVGSGPTRLLLTWECDFTASEFITNRNSYPQDYTISVSSDSTNGADGTWKTVIAVTGNQAGMREHVIPFTGMSWVKMTVTSGQPSATYKDVSINQIDLYDASASNSLNDTFFFSGDSITAIAYDRSDENQPSFAEDVHRAFPNLFPVMIDGGFGGAGIGYAVQNIGLWLSLNPDVHYWLLEWGTNDAFAPAAPDNFRADLQTLVNKIMQAGRVPVIAALPYTNRPGDTALNQEIEALNAEIDRVTQENGLIPGPDFYQLFQAHAREYLRDGIHPTPAGAIAMNLAWFQALRSYL